MHYNNNVISSSKTNPPRRKGIRPIVVLPIGYISIILIGTLLLMLPGVSRGESLSLFEAFFTATSASCVTGLVVVDTGTHFTFLGQLVLLVLIQLGGLGFMTLATLLFGALGRRITLRNRMTTAEALGEDGLSDMVRLCGRAARYTFAFEGVGALVLALRFSADMPLPLAVWNGVFHSISAFCNAGFDLIGGYRSLVPYYNDPIILVCVMALIIGGGLGFVVLSELRGKRRPCGLSLHSRIVLVTTGILLALGTVITLALEWSNPATLGGMSVPEKVLSALFQSVTLRTAGFNTIDEAAMTDAMKLLSSILMFIGAAPAGTAGGIKVTTVAILALTVRAFLRESPDTEAYGWRLGSNLVRRALVLFFGGITVATMGVALVSMAERGAFSLADCLFECASALGTVGLSVGLTAGCTGFSRAVLCILMFMGRAGILTLAVSVGGRPQTPSVRYPEGGVMIG